MSAQPRAAGPVTSDGSAVTSEGSTISLVVMGAHVRRAAFDFSPHPLGELAVEYLLRMAEDWASGTLANRAGALQILLCEYLEPRHDLTAVTMKAYATWLEEASARAGTRRFTPLVASQAAHAALGFYEYGVERGSRDWSDRNLDLMSEAVRRAFRGAGREHYLRSAQRAVSDKEYQQLVLAAGLEMEACRRILYRRAEWRARPGVAAPTPAPTRPGPRRKSRAATAKWLRRVFRWIVQNRIPCDLGAFAGYTRISRSTIATRYPLVAHRVRAWAYLSGARSLASGSNHYPLPDPYCALAVLLGVRNGLRSEEWNLMRVDDLQGSYLAVRTDDHPDTGPEHDLELEPATREAYRILVEWTEDVRRRAPERLRSALQLAESAQFGIARVTSSRLSTERLPKFYAKYFSRPDPLSPHGSPLLHADGRPDQPFSSSLMKFRNAAIRNFLNSEANPAFVQAFARHKSFSTTIHSYSQLHPADIGRHAAALYGSAVIMAETTLRNQVYEKLTPELHQIAALGGHTPLGLCGDPGLKQRPEGDTSASGCALARDCLECPHLFLHVEKRPLLEADARQLLSEAEELEREGYPRDAENRRGAATLRLAHLRRIDQLSAGRRAA